MADNSPIPDRRPLIYGVVAVAVLLTAAVLFWPRADKSDPSTMVLTPESLRAEAPCNFGWPICRGGTHVLAWACRSQMRARYSCSKPGTMASVGSRSVLS